MFTNILIFKIFLNLHVYMYIFFQYFYKFIKSLFSKNMEAARSETSPILQRHRHVQEFHRGNAIGFAKAMMIPGVIEYSLSLFFAKLVSYTFLYWLPLYIAASSKYFLNFNYKLYILC